MSRAIGRWRGRACGPAAGRSNTPIRIIPISTTRRWWRSRSTAIDRERYRAPVERAAEWLVGMHSRNGGWAAFDADNTYYYLNYIPFADHGALLDPPTADVSARCVGLFGAARRATTPVLAGGIDYLRREQETDGTWFGRWGTNYIYGTWSVLAGAERRPASPNPIR